MTKNFLITGAAAGIGLEYTRLMLREGGKVVMTDINAELGTEQEKQLRAEFGDCQVLFVKLDVRSEAEWGALHCILTAIRKHAWHRSAQN